MFEYEYSNLRHYSAEYGILPRFFLSSIFFRQLPFEIAENRPQARK